MGSGDGYGIGTMFGGPIDFTKKKFGLDIQSAITTPHSAYIYFPCVLTI